MLTRLLLSRRSILNFIKNRRKLVVCSFLGLGLLLLNYLFGHVEMIKEHLGPENMPCADEESKNIILKICSMHRNKEISGDICHALCGEEITFKKCLNYRKGKHVILVDCADICTTGNKIPAVLKMTGLNVSKMEQFLQKIDEELIVRLNLNVHGKDMNEVKDYSVDLEALKVLLLELLKSENSFEPQEDEDIVATMWGGQFENYLMGSKTTFQFARSLWSVVKQNEYRISKVFEDEHIFPQIYGTCGPLYLAEYVPSENFLEKLFPFLSSEFPPWRQRAQLAIGIINLVKHLETMSIPLHLCDIKMQHFGQTRDNHVRFIDSDTIFTSQTLLQDLAAPVCSEHSHCDFFDCEGWCNKDVGKCAPQRTNSNLQSVCVKLLKGQAISAFGGLLSTPPYAVAAKLTALVNSCANDITDHLGNIELRQPSMETLMSLHSYLIESINADKNVVL